MNTAVDSRCESSKSVSLPAEEKCDFVKSGFPVYAQESFFNFYTDLYNAFLAFIF